LFKIGYYNKLPEDERNPKPKAEEFDMDKSREFKIDKSQLFKALMKDVRPKSAQQSTELLEGDNPVEKVKSAV